MICIFRHEEYVLFVLLYYQYVRFLHIPLLFQFSFFLTNRTMTRLIRNGKK